MPPVSYHSPMNWLAHLLLSDPDPCTQIGNLLPDLMSSRETAEMPEEFQRGIFQHRLVDSYTDSHPVFRRSTRRIEGDLRRFSTILVDVFYDHILAREWARFSSAKLEGFVGHFYESIDTCRPALTEEAFVRLCQMREGDWLRSYGDLGGIATALQRIGTRLRKPVRLDESVIFLESAYDAFRGDFLDFFPQVQSHVAAHPVRLPLFKAKPL